MNSNRSTREEDKLREGKRNDYVYILYKYMLYITKVCSNRVFTVEEVKCPHK